MDQPQIQIKDLSKKYGQGSFETWALANINLDIKSGDFLAIMGPSGSGKSTLMHILGLLDKPTSGQYILEGKRVNSLTENRLAYLRNQRMGFVFQSFNLLPRTSVLENVQLPLLYRNITASEKHELATKALENVGLLSKIKSTPNQLSGGEQQRVAIARALAPNPQIIFADEPTGNLDTKNSLEIMNILTKLNKGGKTIILVTHEEEIARFANRAIRLRDGKLESDVVSHKRLTVSM